LTTPRPPYACFDKVPPQQVTLKPGLFADRYKLNVDYLASLSPENLLYNYQIEAGLGDTYQRALRATFAGNPGSGDDLHWGWETPGHELRGHFVGHWLSASARVVAARDNPELRVKLERVINGLAHCQEENGGEWVFAIPSKYLDRLAAGKRTWSPQYVMHKTFMGLLDTHRYLGTTEALSIADRAGRWMHRWTAQFDRQQMDDILEVETGGMLEVWADLYAETTSEIYRELLERYWHGRLFDRLLAGVDVLTNKHANTTIPEVLGAARAYEVTGEQRWLDVATAYWRSAVDDRGTFCTGGQTAAERWTPPFEFASRRSWSNQEHCTVYNMIRLSDFLFRWSGDVRYLDYIERNLYNGVLAQQHKVTGMISYFLPLEGGGQKQFGSRTCDFWCCHGSLVQAHSQHDAHAYYVGRDSELVIAQYIPSVLQLSMGGVSVGLHTTVEGPSGAAKFDIKPEDADVARKQSIWRVAINIDAAVPVRIKLLLRVAPWLQLQATLKVDGHVVESRPVAGFFVLDRAWQHNAIELVLPSGVWVDPLPDESNTVAFLDGPIVLAGLCDAEVAMTGDLQRPALLLSRDGEPFGRDGEPFWGAWPQRYRSTGQSRSIRFLPLYEVTDERYSVYFPIRSTPVVTE
jgi:uncharacterized protein